MRRNSRFSVLFLLARALLAMRAEATSWFRSPFWTLMVICRLLRITKDPFMGIPAFRNGLKSDVSNLRHVPVSVIGNEPDLWQAKRLTVWLAFLLRYF